MESVSGMVEKVSSGSVRTLARVIARVENEMPGAVGTLQKLYPKTGHAYIIGISDPPGSGKSIFTDQVTKELRRRKYIAVIDSLDLWYAEARTMVKRRREGDIPWEALLRIKERFPFQWAKLLVPYLELQRLAVP